MPQADLTTAQNPLRILLLEDNSADADLIIHVLKQTSRPVDMGVAASREQFLDLLGKNEFDLVLADFRLPGWTGMEALNALRTLRIDIPLIIVTGSLGDERAVECIKAGAADYILKNNLDRLPIAIGRALDEKRTRGLIERAQQEVHERDERFRQLADNIDEVFFVMDAQFTETLYINPAYERTWGLSREALYDNPQSFLDPIHPLDRVKLEEYIARIQHGEQPGKIEFRVVQPNNEVHWLLTQAVPIRDTEGAVYRITGIALDVTDSRHASIALQESVDRFKSLTDALFDAIEITQDGIIREINRGFLDTFGYDSVEEVIGRPVSDFVDSEPIEESDRRIQRTVEGTYDVVGRKKDGSKIFLEVTRRGHSIDGRPARITALRDMTQRRLLESQFRQAQKMEAVGRLAGGVAHDFNNLLTVITGFTEIVMSDLTSDDPRRADLEQVRRAAETGAGLTRQLLAFSRQQFIEPRIISVEDVVNQVQKLLTHLIGEDIKLVTKFGPVKSFVHMDPGQLEQAVMNLVVNSRDAMPTGGTLTLETSILELDEQRVSEYWPATVGTYAVLSVSDTGIGMDDAIRAKIFEPFFTTKELGKGTGLGLATVYGIVKQSGGFIWVFSEPGNGATFKIFLPLSEEAAGLDQEEQSRQSGPRGAETLLLVEDSKAVRDIAHRVLEQHGYEVLTVESALQALELVRDFGRPIHLLLTDVVMPEMSGRTLAEKFAELQPNAKILYMSGYTDDAVIRHGVLDAQARFLQKPFTPTALAKRVRQVLDTNATPH